VSRLPATLQRLERVLVMVPWLLEHPGVTVDEVAARFGTTREEVLEDLDVLGYCGLPGYGGGDLVEATVAGDRVVVRMAEFFSRPLRLSLREAVTLLLAGRALVGISDLPEADPLRRAVERLEALLGTSGDDPGTPRLAVDLSAPGDEHVSALRRAVEEGRLVRLVYRSGSKAETRERLVEPWALTAAQGSWYLQGWCRTVDGARDFRLDRIRELEVTGERAGERPGGAAPRPPRFEPSADDHEVVLDLRRPAWWVEEQVVVDDVRARGGVRRLRLRTPALEWVARLVLRLGPEARVVAPEALKTRVAELARATSERYRGHER
jgi:predicted DNA-binding transcriptional regulator YafY